MTERYVAYMLRIWLSGEGESAVWRASLESPRTGECRSFASREALLAFLQDVTSEPPAAQVAVADAGGPVAAQP